MKQAKLSKRVIMKKAMFIIISLFLLTAETQAATRTMSACSSSAWDTAYSAAVSGDTIAFPAGSCSVSMTKAIAKTNLTIQGAGAGTTIVTGGFTVSGASANGLRITGIEFRTGPAFDWKGSPSAKLQNVRIDHCTFSNGAYFTSFYGATPTNVVVDHNIYQNITGEGNYVFGNPTSTESFPFVLGTSEGVYYEDNTVTDNSGTMSHFIASRMGSRYIVRYNKFNIYAWDPFDAHDNYEGQNQRGSFTWEFYNNVITYSGTGKRIFHLRGGQGVVYNNYTNNNQSTGIDLNSYMMCQGICTHDQVSCKDHINHAYFWNNKQSCGSLASCDVHNIAACCGGGSTWNAVASCSGGGSSQGLILNTDYFLSAQPGYTAFTYPHPLVTGASGVKPAPPNLLP
jgi:hypothetical protein